MNATDLNAKTVKALNVIARDLGMKRYSKLRKADLIHAIERELEIREIEVESTDNEPVILDVESATDHDTISAIMAAVVAEASVPAVTFSHKAPAKTPEIAAESVSAEVEEPLTLAELKSAYAGIKAVWNRSTGERAKRLMRQLTNIRSQVKALGFNPINVGLGYSIG